MSKQKTALILSVICLLSLFLSPVSVGQPVIDKSETSVELEDIKLICPMKGWISSRYGYRTSPFTNEKEFHVMLLEINY